MADAPQQPDPAQILALAAPLPQHLQKQVQSRLVPIQKAIDQEKPQSKLLERLQQDVEAWLSRFKARPEVTYPQDLPVSQRRDEIAEAISRHQVVVVAGETGSGKTTQIPKICLDIGRGIGGLIGHTQPRRIAARSLATRIGEELKDPQATGYKVRFTDTTSKRAHIKVMTDGILLAETQGDRDLRRYDTIILDEAHERSLNIDFLIGYLHKLLPRRPDLKIIITSATIDTQRFAEHFKDSQGKPAPIIEVSGRTFPVDTRYEPPEAFELPAIEHDLSANVLAALDRLPHDHDDVLIFLPTERDILDLAKSLKPAGGAGKASASGVFPLYGRLSASQQQDVFRLTPGRRRIILATNVAETSLTVPGIRYVIDTGLARVSRYSSRAKVQRLPIERISQASANQRAGRCGRVGPGICIRLYDEEDFGKREDFTAPEILRSNLAGVILRMSALKLGQVDRFPFMEPPKPAAVRDAYKTLQELSAIDDKQKLTDTGRTLARLPVDPRIGRLILAADEENCLAEVLIIASALEAQDPRIRPPDPPDERKKADRAHEQFLHEGSDFFAFLKIWDWYHERKSSGISRRKLDLACKQNYLSALRMREWIDLHRQLKDLARESGLKAQPRQAIEKISDPLHRAMLAGFLCNVAKKSEKGFEYEASGGGGGNKPVIWPGSVLFETKPKWLTCAEQVETTRLYLRTAAQIQPQWIEPIAQHVLKRRVSQPAWIREQGRVIAQETLTLFGLTIVERRPIPYDKVDPRKARELFIFHAVVERDSDLSGGWREHNDGLIDDAQAMQHKLRRNDVLADEQQRFDFYDRLLPPEVCGTATFNAWLKKAEKQNPRVLFMREHDAFSLIVDDRTKEQYPDQLAVGREALPLVYADSPGKKTDGVTLACPLPMLNQVRQTQLDWGIPGTLAERITALIRALPKDVRRAIGPAPEAAKQATKSILEAETFGQGDPAKAIAHALGTIGQTQIDPKRIDATALPDHLRVNVLLVDETGKALADSRSLQQLRQQFKDELDGTFVEIEHPDFYRDDLREWSFGKLPESVEVEHDGRRLKAYPALIDRLDRVDLRLRQSPEQAAMDHRAGLRRLLSFKLKREMDWQLQRLDSLGNMRLKFAPFGDRQTFDDHLRLLIVDRACLPKAITVRDTQAFEACLDSGWNQVPVVVEDLAKRLPSILERLHRVQLAVDRMPPNRYAHASQDIRYQLARLAEPGFLIHSPFNWLAQYPRYLATIERRIERLSPAQEAKDLDAMRRILPWVKKWAAADEQAKKEQRQSPHLEFFRWLLEEYRVSLWAQDLGTAVPVSEKKMTEAWDKV